jgi:cytochrome c oxidase assembly protein Cox11
MYRASNRNCLVRHVAVPVIYILQSTWSDDVKTRDFKLIQLSYNYKYSLLNEWMMSDLK